MHACWQDKAVAGHAAAAAAHVAAAATAAAAAAAPVRHAAATSTLTPAHPAVPEFGVSGLQALDTVSALCQVPGGAAREVGGGSQRHSNSRPAPVHAAVESAALLPPPRCHPCCHHSCPAQSLAGPFQPDRPLRRAGGVDIVPTDGNGVTLARAPQQARRGLHAQQGCVALGREPACAGGTKPGASQPTARLHQHHRRRCLSTRWAAPAAGATGSRRAPRAAPPRSARSWCRRGAGLAGCASAVLPQAHVVAVRSPWTATWLPLHFTNAGQPSQPTGPRQPALHIRAFHQRRQPADRCKCGAQALPPVPEVARGT